jgi:shikimate dehydrogenase
MTAPDKYGVVGNPIAHSRSPEIHQRFASQTRERISYERIEVPLDAFEDRASPCVMPGSAVSTSPFLQDRRGEARG